MQQRVKTFLIRQMSWSDGPRADRDSHAIAPTSQHPYLNEIHTLLLQSPSRAESAQPAPLPPPLDLTPFTLVSTRAQLDCLVHALRRAGEFALDLEHHSHRSYLGLSCLMQISTGHEDWVIDVLALHDEMHDAMRELLADPAITKVMQEK